MMLESPKMPERLEKILVVAAIIVAAMSAGAVWSQDAEEPESSGITEARIENALQELTADGEYDYEESSLDEPQWLLAMQEWFGGLMSRWGESPANRIIRTRFQMFGIVLVLLLAILVLVFILMRLFGRSYGPRGEGGAFDKGMEAMGAWGDGSAKKASELASMGNYRDAVSVLFRSSLIGLDNLGWIKYRTSSASRFYLRQLRRSAELYPVFRDFLQRFEVAYYRKETPDSDDWTFLFDQYHSLVEVATSVRPPAWMRRSLS
jgi:hypothetical protein